jgi:hypothetical protein
MRKLLLIIALALGTGVAQAGNGLLYIGAGVSRNSVRDITATAGNLDSTAWKVWAGFRPISLLGIEADYLKLGSETSSFMFVDGTSTTHLEYKALAVYGVGFLPIPVPSLDVFGKVGLARWTSSGSSTVVFPPGPGSFSSLSDNGSQFAWGVGGQLHLGNLGARLEYENFNVRNTSGANIVSLSVFLNFF